MQLFWDRGSITFLWIIRFQFRLHHWIHYNNIYKLEAICIFLTIFCTSSNLYDYFLSFYNNLCVSLCSLHSANSIFLSYQTSTSQQPPASQQYFSLTINQHQPSATALRSDCDTPVCQIFLLLPKSLWMWCTQLGLCKAWCHLILAILN